MARRRRRFGLADIGLEPPDNIGLSGIGAIDPLELVNIFAPLSAQAEQAPTVIDQGPLPTMSGGELASAAGAVNQKKEAPKAQAPQQEQPQVAQSPEANVSRALSGEDAARRGALMQKEAMVNRAASTGGLAGFGGLIGTIFGGKRRAELEALNAKAAMAEEQMKNMAFQQKSLQLENLENDAIVGRNRAIQSNQANTYEELNVAHLTGRIKDVPEEVLSSKLQTAGIVRNEDGSLPVWEQDLNKAFGAKNVAKWALADGEFRQNLKSLFSVDRDLNKPLFDSLARARKRSLELDKATADLARADFLLTDSKGKLEEDNLTNVNTVLNSMIDNASGVGRTELLSEEQIPFINAMIKAQGNNLLKFVDNNNISILEDTRKYLKDPIPLQQRFQFDFFSDLRGRSDPPVPIRLTEQQIQQQQSAQEALADVKVQLDKAVQQSGQFNQREGNVTQVKDPKEPPKVAAPEAVPKTKKSRSALLKEKRELEKKKRRR